MKHTDLQIGDYVLIEGTPRKVAFISKHKIGYHKEENESRMQYARINMIEPIEVTEEMLLMIGFKKDKDIFTKETSYKYPHKYKEPFISYSIVDNNKIYINDTFMSIYTRVMFLHQIQHFIRFCKLEEL